MSQLAMEIIAPNDFKLATSKVESTQAHKQLPAVSLKEFVTKDSFWRPSDSEFINSYTDLSGNIVRVYSLDFSKTILVLTPTQQGEFLHSLYTTLDEKGFYLHEVFELLSILGY